MRTNYLILAATLLCVSCSWQEEPVLQETKTAYYQVHNTPQDSTYTVIKGDSTYYLNVDPYAYSDSAIYTAASATRNDSVGCRLFVCSKLKINGGSSADISDLVVTVTSVKVSVFTDSLTTPTIYYPDVHGEVAEPTDEIYWENMPEGIRYRERIVCQNPVSFSYKNSFKAEVEVCFIARTKDMQYVPDAETIKCSCTGQFGSSAYKENNVCIVVPLELFAIQFSGNVSEDVEV